jgi:hypothetical protein
VPIDRVERKLYNVIIGDMTGWRLGFTSSFGPYQKMEGIFSEGDALFPSERGTKDYFKRNGRGESQPPSGISAPKTKRAMISTSAGWAILMNWISAYIFFQRKGIT